MTNVCFVSGEAYHVPLHEIPDFLKLSYRTHALMPSLLTQ